MEQNSESKNPFDQLNDEELSELFLDKPVAVQKTSWQIKIFVASLCFINTLLLMHTGLTDPTERLASISTLGLCVVLFADFLSSYTGFPIWGPMLQVVDEQTSSSVLKFFGFILLGIVFLIFTYQLFVG